MRYDEIRPSLRKAVGFHEALRRLGFVPEHIRLTLKDGTLYVAVYSAGNHTLMSAGEYPSDEAALGAEWDRVAEAVRNASLSDEDMYRCLTDAVPEGMAVEFAMSLMRAGARIPGKTAN